MELGFNVWGSRPNSATTGEAMSCLRIITFDKDSTFTKTRKHKKTQQLSGNIFKKRNWWRIHYSSHILKKVNS
jgi:hypothetical protein